MSKKLLIVSTRLPVTVKKVKGKLVYKKSDGGLATGMTAVSKTRDSLWIGWPGIASDELTKKDIQDITVNLKQNGCHPVFLTQKQVDLYYSGYCNATIWPLFHYFTDMTVFNRDYWQMYEEVNHLFSIEVARFMVNDSYTWIHDYQLMLLPQMLRRARRDASIGFFLHAPFPSYEIFRLLPERNQVLEGLIGADVIGFHTYDYARHFLQSVQRHLGHENKLSAINLGDRMVQADAFPIGIDYEKFAKNPARRQVKKIARGFNVFKRGQKVILAIDRADYSKGIPARLDAFELFLQQHKDYHEKVVMIMLAVPSRGDIDAYQELRETIEQRVSRINGHYSTVNWTPIIYMHKSMSFDEVTALYAKADVMYVTPLRDGMNLVAKEYIATNHKKSGVLVLSEMAGVASELPESVQVNPNNKQMVADALLEALEMPKKEQKSRMAAMQQRISTYTIEKWAQDFIEQLEKMTTTKKRQQYLSRQERSQILKSYRAAKSRLILLDYDGTLKPFVSSPQQALAEPSKKLRALLKKLQSGASNQVVIVSGRPRKALSAFFKDMNLGLIAEHGAWVQRSGAWVKSAFAPSSWKKPYLEILNRYAERTPGAIVEEKDYSLVWHFRNVSPDLAFVRTEELKMELEAIIEHDEFAVFEGRKVLEVKSRQMNKGAIVTELITEKTWDFIMCIGDDYTDEDMFSVLPERAYSLHVGDDETLAKQRLRDVDAVIELLTDLSKSK